LEVLTKDFSASQSMDNKRLLGFEYYPIIEKVLCFGIPILRDLNPSNSFLAIGHHYFYNQENDRSRVGLYTFSYNLKNSCHVSLPDFTFYTLIISNYHIHDAYNTIPFNHKFMKKPYINLDDDIAGSCLYPKFISLYSTQKTNYGPIFLKQNCKQIRIKSINCKCKTCSNIKQLITSAKFLDRRSAQVCILIHLAQILKYAIKLQRKNLMNSVQIFQVLKICANL
jgi:hypothetical protein